MAYSMGSCWRCTVRVHEPSILLSNHERTTPVTCKLESRSLLLSLIDTETYCIDGALDLKMSIVFLAERQSCRGHMMDKVNNWIP